MVFFSFGCEKNSNSNFFTCDAYNYSGVTFTNIKREEGTYKLDRNIVVYSEIIGYDSTEHVFQLKDNAGARIRDIDYPVNPTQFAIAVEGEIIYIANFIPGYSSMSCDHCITIDPYSYSNNYKVMLGYPGASSFFSGNDPRNDIRIIERFKEDNKLKSLMN